MEIYSHCLAIKFAVPMIITLIPHPKHVIFAMAFWMPVLNFVAHLTLTFTTISLEKHHVLQIAVKTISIIQNIVVTV